MAASTSQLLDFLDAIREVDMWWRGQNAVLKRKAKPAMRQVSQALAAQR